MKKIAYLFPKPITKKLSEWLTSSVSPPTLLFFNQLDLRWSKYCHVKKEKKGGKEAKTVDVIVAEKGPILTLFDHDICEMHFRYRSPHSYWQICVQVRHALCDIVRFWPVERWALQAQNPWPLNFLVFKNLRCSILWSKINLSSSSHSKGNYEKRKLDMET